MGPIAVEGDPSEKAVFRAGDLVASRFRIVRYLARGGMGELYEAEDLVIAFPDLFGKLSLPAER
jgi:hypothetical protein